jgi:hypothetical protein
MNVHLSNIPPSPSNPTFKNKDLDFQKFQISTVFTAYKTHILHIFRIEK